MVDSISVGKPEPWPEGDLYLLELGRLIAQYHSLEFALRIYLQALPTARPIGLESGTSPFDFPVGTSLPESEITSYDSLGELIKRVNDSFRGKDIEEIDKNILVVRDALAHGRVSSSTPSSNMRLVKFGKGKDNTVKVEFNEELSVSRLTNMRKVVGKVIMRVMSELPAHNNQINQGQG